MWPALGRMTCCEFCAYTIPLKTAIVMSCSCADMETQYGRGDCKCAYYRERFPDCTCEHESVSEHSPGRVEDNEVLVRTLFRNQQIDPDGHLKPAYFRHDPTSRGFSVDRVLLMGAESLASSKRIDARYNGYLQFIATWTKDVRGLLDGGTRLFCVYDSGTVENSLHADICQNLHVEPGTQRRKSRMMEIAWQLRSVFGPPQSVPPTFPT